MTGPQVVSTAAERQVVLAEVFGAHLGAPEANCSVRGSDFRYVADPALKSGLAFRFGAFFSKGVFSDEVFRYPREQRIAVLAESPIDRCYADIPEVLRRFSLVFTHQRHLLDQRGAFRPLHFGTNWIGVTDDASTRGIQDEHPAKSRQVSFVGSLEHADIGAYLFRREIAEFAVSRGDVDCFGRGIRPIDGKREAIAPYRFSIAMENAAADDYFSEKLVDCLLLETVPIYFGWPSVATQLDERGLLAFKNRAELALILDSLTTEMYERMRPYVLANKARVIALRWHNHQGMLSRMSEQLPAGLLTAPPIAHRAQSRMERVWRRLRHRLTSSMSGAIDRGADLA